MVLRRRFDNIEEFGNGFSVSPDCIHANRGFQTGGFENRAEAKSKRVIPVP
jgi:hypothetical protein